ncbi:hypothetical protein BgAZ_100490 [Babesia gibsoni]|uniref:Uncharacterized protein n=1 Tax=Babesia gibsoni TaxID=33632 RepID=A0AAD8PEY4_BABGI|nr:hypothetical protein BgAZ_100490 [Babesia gibsoni]
MASSSKDRDHSNAFQDEERMTKRHASGPWPPSRDAPNRFDGQMATPNMWVGPPGQMPLPQAMGMMPMPPFSPMVMQMMNNGDVFKQPVDMSFMANMGYPPQLGITSSQQTTTEEPNTPRTETSTPDVLGTYPVDIQKLKEHLMYENELYYTLRTRITERDHFAAIISLIERYFKGALGASTRKCYVVY